MLIQHSIARQRLLCSLMIFILVFYVLYCSVDTIWFREDDLGTILGGIIRDWRDAIRVFLSDCRSFITPCNYQRTVPNVISGFLRPMQNVVFSVVYYFYGVDPWAYYITHIGIHAANAALFFLVCSFWLPISLSMVAGAAFAFYPEVSWLTWIGTVQNSLATFFLLLMAIFCYCAIWSVKKSFRKTVSLLQESSTPIIYPFACRAWYWLAGCMFLLSILSRENAIFLPFWFALGAYIFFSPAGSSCWYRVRIAFSWTWIFFAADFVYTVMRWCAFGGATLSRTINNIALRFPSLAHYVCLSKGATVVQQVNGVHVAGVVPQGVALSTGDWAWSFVLRAYHMIADRFDSWFFALFHISLDTGVQRIVAAAFFVCLVLFLFNAYWQHRTFLWWLSCGVLLTVWPGVLTYPCPRYLNIMYPVIIFMVMFGIYAAHKFADHLAKRALSMILLSVILILTMKGIYTNSHALHDAGRERIAYKQRFDDFFARYHCAPSARFFVLSSPFVSDIQSIFQAYCSNLQTMVVFDPFMTLAEKGFMGCRKEYRVTGVASEIVAVPGGFRLISHDPYHCGWWLRFSDFPIAWSAEHRAYEWTNQPYRVGQTYPCSIGTFTIHAMADDDCVTDLTFMIDKRWIDEHTIFVAWDTLKGRYEVLFEHITSKGVL